MSRAEFLLEIGTEEIPDWMIGRALRDLQERFLGVLEEHELHEGVECATEATPRRLVLIARGVPLRQQDREETLTGPPRSVAFDKDGKPAKAAEGFARRAGLKVEELEVSPEGRLSARRVVTGKPMAEILAGTLAELILKVHFPKTMYWTGKGGPRFIRPIRWLVALLGGEVVPFEIAGVRAGNLTHGHRRLGVADIKVSSAKEFRAKLRENFVLLSAEERRRKIASEMAELISNGCRVRENQRLLDTLVNLVEFPTAVSGTFDREFLDLPDEVLETVMQHHQRYFAVENEQGRIEPRFVAVANLDGDPDGLIRRGHERVLRARFNDARFFWETDLKRSLEERIEDLKSVTFQAQLGSYFDKIQRNARIAEAFVQAAGLPEEVLAGARRAVELSKSDLTTELVGEFPELQGVVGGLYAKVQGEPKAVADAIYEQYLPVAAGGPIPSGPAGQAVSLADKLDTLGGFFRLGMIPSGSKDPFALRRAAYGVVRILIEGRHAVTLSALCGMSGAGERSGELREFFVDRLRYYLRDVKGHRYDEVNAVLAASDDEPLDAAFRVEAIAKVRPTENFEPLAVSFKRIENILRKAGGVEQYAGKPLDTKLLEPGPEAELHAAFEELKPRVARAKQQGGYAEALTLIASLRPAVDKYFDHVLVMAEDETLRNNRLALLARLRKEFSTIADFAEIAAA